MFEKKYLLLGLAEVALIVVMAWVSLVWYQPLVEEPPTLEELWEQGLLEPSQYDDVLEEREDVYLSIDGIDLEQGWIDYTLHNVSENKIPFDNSSILEVAYLGKWYVVPYKPSKIQYVYLLIGHDLLPGEKFSDKKEIKCYAYTGAGRYRLIFCDAIAMSYERLSSRNVMDEDYIAAYFTIE